MLFALPATTAHRLRTPLRYSVRLDHTLMLALPTVLFVLQENLARVAASLLIVVLAFTLLRVRHLAFSVPLDSNAPLRRSVNQFHASAERIPLMARC